MSNVEELTVTDLLVRLWKYKLKIVLVVSVFAVGSIIYALSMPNMYRSTVVAVPAESNNQDALSSIAGQFGGLASLAGVNLGSGNSNLTLTLETIESREFLTSIIEKHSLKEELFAVDGWSYISKEYSYDNDIYDVAEGKWVRDVELPKVAEPSLLESYVELKKQFLNIQHDPKSNVIQVSVTHYSPYFSQKLATLIVKELNSLMRKRDIEEAVASITYLTGILNETSISSVQGVFFSLIEQQEQKRMLASIQEEYALKVIDPAVVAEEKNSPKRASIVVLGCIIGFLFSVFFIYLQSVLSNRQ